MFILSELQDIVRIDPHKFSQDMEQQIRDELNKKFANKVSQCRQNSFGKSFLYYAVDKIKVYALV